MKRAFEFTEDQEQALRRWAQEAAASTQTSPDWRVGQLGATQEFRALLAATNFEGGTDLNSAQLDAVLALARKVVGHQWLNRTLYEGAGIQTFNARLRVLLFGSKPLHERASSFMEMAKGGVQTASQFLCLLDPKMYPVVTGKTWQPLNLSEEQEDAAMQDALANAGARRQLHPGTDDSYTSASQPPR